VKTGLGVSRVVKELMVHEVLGVILVLQVIKVHQVVSGKLV